MLSRRHRPVLHHTYPVSDPPTCSGALWPPRRWRVGGGAVVAVPVSRSLVRVYQSHKPGGSRHALPPDLFSYRLSHVGALSPSPAKISLPRAKMAVGDPTSCTVDTCPVPDGFLRSPPAAAGSLVLLAAFGVLVPLNLYTGARYRTALFSATLALGILLEVMGYVGRFLLASDVADRRYFVLFLLGTVTGPTIVSAAIYLVLPHIVGLYGKSVRFPWRPVYIGVGFLALDVFTLAFQAVGGAFAANGLSKVEVGWRPCGRRVFSLR